MWIFLWSIIGVLAIPREYYTQNYQVVNKYPHNSEDYTQGLFVESENILIESTGLYGNSKLQRVNLLTNEVLQVVKLDSKYFGEGVAALNNKLYQLTWLERKILIYNQTSLELIVTVALPSQIKSGWGICTDGQFLYITEGSNKIFVVDPDTFNIQRIIYVKSHETPVQKLNELEYIDGEIWANIYTSHYIIRIDPATGEVISFINFTNLEEDESTISWEAGEVLNGIAYREGRLFITGKHWNYIYEVELTQPAPTVKMPGV